MIPKMEGGKVERTRGDPPPLVCAVVVVVLLGGGAKMAETRKEDSTNGKGENVKEGFRDSKERDERQKRIVCKRTLQ